VAPAAGLPEDTRERLIAVAKMLFAEKGLDGTTVKDLADAAGVNVSLVSYHFGGKDGLYRACLEQFGNARLAASRRILQPPQSSDEFKVRLRIFIEEMFCCQTEHAHTTRMVLRESDVEEFHAHDIFKNTFLKMFETLVDFMKTAQQKEILRPDLDPQMVAGLFFGNIVNTLHRDHLNFKYYGQTIRDSKYRELTIDHILSLFLNGSLKPRG